MPDKIQSTAKVPLSKAENIFTAQHLCVNSAMELGKVILLVAYMILANTLLTDNYLFFFFFFFFLTYFPTKEACLFLNSRSTLAPEYSRCSSGLQDVAPAPSGGTTAAPARTGLAERLSGLFTGNMASRSVGELQEMEGGLVCEDAALP